jgi:hypothetical protein
MNLFELIDAAKHNRNLYKSGKANRDEVRSTTVGWRPDPIHGEDGMTPDPGNDCIRPDGNRTAEYDTPSGNREYSRVLYRKSEERRKGRG